eukprot:g13743.t1
MQARQEEAKNYTLDPAEKAAQDVWTLFMIMDHDQTGLVNLEEFVSGCLQGRGPAKSIQLVKMSYENKVTRQALKKVGMEIRRLTVDLSDLRRRNGMPESDVAELSKHAYGNYVVQHLLEHGDALQRHQLLQQLCAEAKRLARHKVASYVIESALVHAGPEDEMQLKAALAESIEALQSLSASNYGSIYWDYPPLRHQERIFRRAVIGSLSLVGLGASILAIYLGSLSGCCSKWLTFLSTLAEVKVIISVVRLGDGRGGLWLNYQRKSTVGWTIYNVLLDFTGGLLSVAQLLLDSWLTDDWSKVSGDPAKLMLGNVSVFFDIIFMVQHYCLYPQGAQRCCEISDSSEA